MVNDDIASLSSERQGRAAWKTEREIAKWNAHCQEKEYQFFHVEHADERLEAAATHQHMQELKEKDIKICELDLEALRLKIQLRELEVMKPNNETAKS